MANNSPLRSGFYDAVNVPQLALNSNAIAKLDAVHTECYDKTGTTHTVSNDIGYNSTLTFS